MAWSSISGVGAARTSREKVSLTNWARRGLPALVFIASALLASPAHAANPDASISITFDIDENCLATATMAWSDQPGGVRPELDFCEFSTGCFGYVSVDRGSSGELRRQVQLSPSLELHHWYAIGGVFVGSLSNIRHFLAAARSDTWPVYCGSGD